MILIDDFYPLKDNEAKKKYSLFKKAFLSFFFASLFFITKKKSVWQSGHLKKDVL